MHGPTVTSKERGVLWSLVDDLLRDHRLILASNRGPMEYHISPETHEPQPRRGSGGVVTALSSLTNYVDFTWIASVMGEGDRRVAEMHAGKAIRSPLPGQRVSVRFVNTARRTYHKYYNIVCNPLLWFLQHYMWSSPYTPRVDAAIYDAWETGYVTVNREFADAIIDEARQSGRRALIMVHDYQLYLVPGMVREKLPDAHIQHFLHIPWPASSYWELLPRYTRVSICESLCNADIVGFQASRDVRAFLDSCNTFLPESRVDYAAGVVHYRGRATQVRAYPISIDVDEVRQIALSPRAEEYDHRLRPALGKQTIIRVDRAEPSKNIVRGFQAYDVMLERHPELRGNVRFLAFLVPSRTHIRQYQRYVEEIEEAIKQTNSRFSTPTWQPVQVYFENNYVQAIAAMRLYDVLIVNAVIDGMNLVAKEGPVVNTKDGVLILSESTGAHEQLQVGALSVAAADVEGTARAIYRALTMTPAERTERAGRLRSTIEREDITHWLYAQLHDVRALTA
ncbi:MAG: trehalose-6-phosphate synthase [SAR202 cluster bacterium]|nr:trehalose-6-phosphate synthase [SAR202 cluster bacterium]